MAGVANSSFVNGRMSPLRFLRKAGGDTAPDKIPEAELIRMDRFTGDYPNPQPLVDAYRTRLWIAFSGAFSLWAGFEVPNDPDAPATTRKWFKFHDQAAGKDMVLVEPVPAGCVVAVLSSTSGPVYFSQTV